MMRVAALLGVAGVANADLIGNYGPRPVRPPYTQQPVIEEGTRLGAS